MFLPAGSYSDPLRERCLVEFVQRLIKGSSQADFTQQFAIVEQKAKSLPFNFNIINMFYNIWRASPPIRQRGTARFIQLRR